VAAAVVSTSIVVACQYQAPNVPSDAQSDGPPILPDAGPCASASKTCFSDGSGGEVLQSCSAAGADPTVTPCPWGCVSTNGAHCGELQPSGGAVEPADLLPVQGQTLVDVDLIADTTTINTVTGEITDVRGPGAGVVNGIDFSIRNNVAIFRVKSLTISDDVNIRGINGIAFVALETIAINEDVELADCANSNAAQGGFTGGAPETLGNGPGGGAAGVGDNDDSSGGGGGGHAGSGGSGGPGQTEPAVNGGTTFGTATIDILVGGAGGGGGGNNGGRGGNGGGAIQLVANVAITFSGIGEINAGGCGGQSGQDQIAAGGGGAGGAILIEAPTITMAANAGLFVGGGGGGGGDRVSEGATNGENGRDDTLPAAGGTPGNNGGSGGDGAANTTLTGAVGLAGRNGGGGGGGIGWIRLNTRSGMAVTAGASLSPALGAGSPASIGTAIVQ
jgi:hypothetical protein